MTRADALRPMHRSVLETHQRARGYRPRPVNMSTVALTSEQRECIERIAIGIFTDMTNSGATLQETLAAVYLSGSENALAACHEPANVIYAAPLWRVYWEKAMSDIKRYQPITDIYGRAKMEKDPAGDYVDADDYERLRAELADARQEVVALRATEDNLRAEVERLRQQVAQIDPQEVMRLADEYARLCENWTTNGSYKDAVEKARVALARAVGSKE